MIRKCLGLISVLICSAAPLFAQTEYAAKVTVNSGNSFVVKKLNIQGDRLYPETGNSFTSLSMIKALEFRFSGISLGMCESMFRTGDRKALEGLIEQNVGPLAQYSNLPTNLGDYLVWWMKVQYWNGNETGAGRTIGYIRQTGNQAYIDEASMYFTLMLLNQGKLENAKTVFSSVGNPREISVPMTEYIEGLFALEAGELRNAMRKVAQLVAFHSRNEEWMPPATVLEAQIYQQLGQPQKAEAVANELIIAYPNSRWSKLGETIKMESTGTRGG
jgi:tetratricopeptide (TPR) repeat protein